MNRRFFALLLALFLIPVAAAQASIPLQNPRGRPLDTTQAGAATRFNIHVELGGSQHIKDLTQQLPRGLQANAFFPNCPVATWQADNCPANTQVGTSSVGLSLMGVPSPDPVTGRIYYLVPDPGQLPGLGIILDAPTGKQFQRGETQINPQLGVLESTIRNFPQTAMVGPVAVPIRINSLDVILSSAFIKNPLECDPVVTRFLVTSYEDPGNTSTAEAPFTPTGCAAPPAPPGCRVPNLVGRKIAAARRAVRTAHCRVGNVRRKDAADRKQGRVIRQSPAAGRRFPRGKRINLVVGK